MAYGNNDMKSYPLYNARKMYEEICKSDNPEYVDLRGNRLFFGKVDYDFNAIMLKGESSLRMFKQKKPAKALEFVVDAFEDLKKYIKVCENRFPGFVLETDDFLKDMKVKKGWTNVNNNYSDLLQTYNVIFHNSFIPQNSLDKKIKNVDDYIAKFMEFYEQTDATLPLTRSTFVLSRMTDPLSSGLMLELEDLNHADDEVKIKKYYAHRHFGFYVKAARKFGFLIDKNAPWRLIANFNSPNMLKYLERYGTNGDEIFDKYYVKTYLSDAETLKRYMIFYYNDYVRATPATESLIGEGGRLLCKREMVLRKKFNYEAYQRAQERQSSSVSNPMVSDDYWYPKYYALRMLEADKKVDRHKLARETRTIMRFIHISLDKPLALSYINDEAKTTFRRSAFMNGPEVPLNRLPVPPTIKGRLKMSDGDAPNLLDLPRSNTGDSGNGGY